MKILLAVDGSDYTTRMLDYLAAHPEWFGAAHEYTALTVVPAITAHAARFVSRADCEAFYRDTADEALAPVRVFAERQGWHIECKHVAGHAPEAIAAFARQHGAEVLVMGSHGRSALSNVVPGSVATGVLARCAVPVLLIR